MTRICRWCDKVLPAEHRTLGRTRTMHAACATLHKQSQARLRQRVLAAERREQAAALAAIPSEARWCLCGRGCGRQLPDDAPSNAKYHPICRGALNSQRVSDAYYARQNRPVPDRVLTDIPAEDIERRYQVALAWTRYQHRQRSAES